MNHTTRRRAAATRVALSHLDPRPLTGERMMRRLQDVVAAHDLPRWRADTGADPDGTVWAAVGWVSRHGEITVREPWSRHAPRRLSAKVRRIRDLEAAGRLRPARRTPTIREDAPAALLRDVLNLTRSDAAREVRRHLPAARTMNEHPQEDA